MPTTASRCFQWLTIISLAVSIRGFTQSDSASLTIRFAYGINHFHVGEVIPIELSFTASLPDTYDMDTRNYDRSGRLNMEQFHVSPPGRDPLASYFSTGIQMGGGLGSRVLTLEPQIMREDLNEWVSLDQPGHYTLYVSTNRVWRRGATRNESVQLRSNAVEFDVIAADPSWQGQALMTAISILDNATSTDEAKEAAMRTLRFLDSEQSIHELVKHFDSFPDGRRFDCVGGLAGSKHQGLVVKELEQQMAVPDTAITLDYIYTLTKLKFDLEHQPLPPYPEHDPEKLKPWQEQMRIREKEFTAFQDFQFEKAAGLVSVKQGRARAESVRTLLLRPARGSGDIQPLTSLPATEVASAFLAMSPDQQWTLLSFFWERLRLPAMVRPLEAILTHPEIQHNLLRDAALGRLYELDANEAIPYILDEIKHPHVDRGMFTVKGKTLAVLPKDTLPEFDQVLAARLAQKESRTLPLDAQLVGRYSTRSILPTVKSIYQDGLGTWDCVTEDGFVLYFLRTEPDYGAQRLAASPWPCITESLRRVTEMGRWQEVEPAAIAQLDNPDLNRARQAAEALSKYGTVKAEKAMWKRLRSFNRQWADRENDLNPRRDTPRDANDAMGFQYGLVQSLGRAQGWILSDEEVTELETIALGSERNNVKQFHWSSPVAMSVNVLFDGQFRGDINNQYFSADIASLCAKLGQYPSGTQFNLTMFGEANHLTNVRQEIRDAAMQHGLVIEDVN